MASPPAGRDGEPGPVAAPPASRFKRIVKRIWWLHSFGALAIGCGVMLFARAGLAYADKLLMVLLVSFLLMFVALRFIVGPANRSPDEHVARKGVRLATNYVIKQLYQQMFFFLVPLYASSATWSLASFNWWLAPVLLVCAVLSTMDLIFDNFVMERRWLASAMYGLAMFAALNVVLPLVFGVTHFAGLLIAATASPLAVALLSFSTRAVLDAHGLSLVLIATLALVSGAYFGRRIMPPAPLAMPETAVGHGTLGGYECLPGSKHVIRADQLDGLRCGSRLIEPGGVKEGVLHVWKHGGREVARLRPEELQGCDGDGVIARSYLPKDAMPADPVGKWQCITETEAGQLVGLRRFKVAAPANGLEPDGAGDRPEGEAAPAAPAAAVVDAGVAPP